MTKMTHSKTTGFQGARVVAFESRLAESMAALIERQGGIACLAPSMREVPLTENAEAFAFGQKLFSGKIDLLICMTGVGTRILIEALSTRYETEQVIQQLSRIPILARGPKPVAVLRKFQIPIALTAPEPNTWVEILEVLDQNSKTIPLKNRQVAVQEYGLSNEVLVEALKSRGANLLTVPVYRWALPENTQPLLGAIRQIVEGKVQVALFTSAIQLRHALQVAAENGLEQSLREALAKLVIASIGPTTTETLEAEGLSADFEPSHPKMGILVTEVAQQAQDLIQRKQARPGQRFSVETVEPSSSNLDPQARRESLFLKACRREKTARTPVWLMRQAGRFLARYRQIRSEASFLEMCKQKELVTEVTLMPVEQFDLDAAILFSDILLVIEPMGLNLNYRQSGGPAVGTGIRSAQAVDELTEISPEENLTYVFEAVRSTRRHLDAKIPLIGFSGAPFTLAAYLIEGGSSKTFDQTKQFMKKDPAAWDALLEKLTRGLIPYLNGQIEAGVDAVQIFDSWVGCLSPSEYRRFVFKHSQALIQGIRSKVPVIHFGTGTGPFLESFREAGGDVIGVDFRVQLDAAWKRIGHDVGIQGNLDPKILADSKEGVQREVKRILKQVAGRPGHIFNLGHGVLPETPVENVQALVEAVHSFSARGTDV